MSEEEPRPEEQTAPILPPDQSPAQGHQQRWRDRSWSLPTVVAVGLVAVLLGGLGGAAIASVGDHQDQRGGPGFGRMQGGPGTPPGQQWGHSRSGHGQQPSGPTGPGQGFGQGGQGRQGTIPTPPTPSPTR